MLGACEVGASGAHLEIAYDHARETKVQFQQRPFRYRICGVSGLRSISPLVAMSVRGRHVSDSLAGRQRHRPGGPDRST